jgi:hypothetical protein
MQQEQREAGLRRHARDATDRHVGASRAVEEFHVDVDRGPVSSAADRDLVSHLVEVESPIPLLARRTTHHSAGTRWHVDLRLHPRGADLSDLLCPGRQDAIGDQKNV